MWRTERRSGGCIGRRVCRSVRSLGGWGSRGTRCGRLWPPRLTDGVEAQVRALLVEFPRMPATVIAQRIGWAHSMTTLKNKLRQIRPEYVGIEPVDRVVYRPGVVAQCNLWSPEIPVPVGPGQQRVLPVLMMTLAFPPVPDRDPSRARPSAR